MRSILLIKSLLTYERIFLAPPICSSCGGVRDHIHSDKTICLLSCISLSILSWRFVEIPPLGKGQSDGWRTRTRRWIAGKRCQLRLIVTGNIGVKEIERLIKKLELDKEILADQDDEENKGIFA